MAECNYVGKGLSLTEVKVCDLKKS